MSQEITCPYCGRAHPVEVRVKSQEENGKIVTHYEVVSIRPKK